MFDTNKQRDLEPGYAMLGAGECGSGDNGNYEADNQNGLDHEKLRYQSRDSSAQFEAL